MTTLRFLLILLLLLNALAFASIKGWLGFAPPRGEPERISNQLHPDRFRFVGDTTVAGSPATSKPGASVAATVPEAPRPPAEPTPVVEPIPAPAAEPASVPEPASAPESAPAAETLCFSWSGLSAAEADRLAALLGAGGLAARQSRVGVPSSWWVRIPPLENREAAERKVRELRAQGISDLFIVQEAGPNQFAISLGLFKTESSSKQHLAQLRAKGVRGAGIAARDSNEFRIEVDAERGALDAALGRDALANRHTGCTR